MGLPKEGHPGGQEEDGRVVEELFLRLAQGVRGALAGFSAALNAGHNQGQHGGTNERREHDKEVQNGPEKQRAPEHSEERPGHGGLLRPLGLLAVPLAPHLLVKWLRPAPRQLDHVLLLQGLPVAPPHDGPHLEEPQVAPPRRAVGRPPGVRGRATAPTPNPPLPLPLPLPLSAAPGRLRGPPLHAVDAHFPDAHRPLSPGRRRRERACRPAPGGLPGRHPPRPPPPAPRPRQNGQNAARVKTSRQGQGGWGLTDQVEWDQVPWGYPTYHR